MKNPKSTIAALLLAFSLVACGPGGATTETAAVETPTLDQQAMDAAVKATVSAELTRLAIENPSATPPTEPLTETPAPTEALPPTEIPPPSPTISALALDDQALFLADVSIPDGSEVIGGEPFTKTWRIQNIGLNTWTTEYGFVFVNGDQMEGFPIFFEEDVPPGTIIEISIPMVAPQTGGEYAGYWMLVNADGGVFGIGEAGNQAVLVSIVVIEPTPVPTATPTTAPTATATP